MMSGPIAVDTCATGAAGLVTGGFRVSDMFFPPMLSLGSHYHERACFSVVLEGSMDEVFAGNTCFCPQSTIIAKPAGERHTDHFLSAGTRTLAIEPDPSQYAESLCSRVEILDRISHFRDGGVTAVAWRIVRELQAPDAVTPLAVDGLVLELFAMAGRRRASPRTEKRPPPWLGTAREVLHARFAESFEVADVAAEVGVHPDHLARVFNAHFGVSLGSYVRRLRLDWAATQLSTTDEPLSNLALCAGFADQSHFTRAFKRHTGISPAQYRQATRR